MHKRKFGLKEITILALIVIVPGFLYYLLIVFGKNRYKPLPYYGPKIVAKTGNKKHGKFVPDTIYHQLPDFKLHDQNGKEVTSNSFKGHITVVNFFYTECAASCIRVCDYMDSLARQNVKKQSVNFVSITVNPQKDNIQVLKKFATHYNADAFKWQFLTGDTSQIYNLARHGFLVNAIQTGPQDFNFSNKIILVDAENRIRGYYTGGSINEVERLNTELILQIDEEKRKIKAPDM